MFALKYYIICVLCSFIARIVTCVCKIKAIFAMSFRHYTEDVNYISFVSIRTKRVPTHWRPIILSCEAIWPYFNCFPQIRNFIFCISIFQSKHANDDFEHTPNVFCDYSMSIFIGWFVLLISSKDSTIQNAFIIIRQKCTGQVFGSMAINLHKLNETLTMNQSRFVWISIFSSRSMVNFAMEMSFSVSHHHHRCHCQCWMDWTQKKK